MARRVASDGVRVLMLASGATVALWFVPFAEVIVYPIRLFVTIVHEAAHALAALATGGSVVYMHIRPDGSGVTATRGGLAPLISSAGYVGAMLYGSALLAWCRRPRRAQIALWATALLMAVMTLAFIRPILSFGFLVGAAWSILLSFAAGIASLRIAQFLVGFLAVQSCLNALFDLKHLFLLSATEVPTDALAMQELTRIPALVWALLWSGLSIGILVVVLRRYGRAGR
ncbi:MAG: M50 family metallopeptidase [Acidobacteriota bacterium]|nr:M50 family metallopeptidase [Blastocatellia bacterium]MDW8167578.1 M50 family metallopeptidase [Acidobacteriota bacterium]MDW8256178.1 M50 family metallopeptidase [Acidobacteriota bacterium]